MEEFNAAVHFFGAAGKAGVLSGRIRYSLYPVGRLSPLSAEGVDDFPDSPSRQAFIPSRSCMVPSLCCSLLVGRSSVLGKVRRSLPPADPPM